MEAWGYLKKLKNNSKNFCRKVFRTFCFWFSVKEIFLRVLRVTCLLFLGVGKYFRQLIHSCHFFLPGAPSPVNENFKFLENCPNDFYKILHRHFTPKGAPACAKASKSYDWVNEESPKFVPREWGIPKNCPEGRVGPLPRDRGGAK